MDVYANRTVSSFPISIGTALALETLFTGELPPYDEDRAIPDRVDPALYKGHFFNIKTLIRNILGAVPNKDMALMDVEGGVFTLLQEIDVIKTLYREQTHGECAPYFYLLDFRRWRKYRDIVTPREPSPGRLKEISYIENVVTSAMEDLEYDNNFRSYKDYITDASGVDRYLITTHYPHDLLSYKRLRRLALLESHTGILKERDKWYTKYHKVGKEDMSTLPFLERLLYFFGDNVMFQPRRLTDRRRLLDLSRRKRWTPHTSEEKVRHNLSMYERDLYEQIYRN